ncbi:MAG TPA: PQQ-dependent sugar dehydrogenase [Gemmatimonadales bacterium]|nr:PQQ-dependent sugar dehydrogenase [Gemmatimonadales bacterium]
MDAIWANSALMASARRAGNPVILKQNQPGVRMLSLLSGYVAASMSLFLAACSNGNGAPSDQPPPDTSALALQPVADGLAFPLYLTAPPGDDRLFVVEKGGRIRIVENGALLPTPFLDVSSLVSRGSEQGLLGLAFHPDYASNGRFFVDYTDTNGDTRIVQYHVSSDANTADPASAHILLTVEQPYSNHNGGQLAFGPDGDLFIGMGDGGSGGDPQGHGQDAGDLLGSLLRIDVDSDTGYAIPADNPWVDSSGARGEVWSIGLRNPWRFSFDRGNGDLYIADVGQNEIEEVNVSPSAGGRSRGRGANYGWNIMEGNSCFSSGSCDRSGLVLPVTQYTHADGCSVTGGYVYRGDAIPSLQGTYFYADFCSGWVRSFRFEDGTATEQRSWPSLAPGGSVPSFGEDARGELYLMSADGGVYRVVSRQSSVD